MSKRILVVEDQEDNRQILRDLLGSAGYQMTEAWDGEAGVSAAKEQHPDLILMDIQLPHMDGYEATRRIKADPELKSIPIIAVTSYALNGDDDKAHAAGCDGYVTKPYSPRQLLETIRHYLQRTEQLEMRSQEIAKLNELLERRVANQVAEIERMSRLRRFLPPQVADLIVASGTEKQLESHRREITALFCDLRGYTGFSESSDPEDVMALLREYHAAIGTIIFKYGGTLERFAGDGVMVIFNDPVPVENPALQAVLMALDMRTAIEELMEKWRLLGHDIGFGIGIAHGFATLGTIGFEGRWDYAAIGTVSNVASRLCDEAKPGQILISPRVMLAVEKAVTVEPVGEFALKGIRRPVFAYNVLESSPSKSR